MLDKSDDPTGQEDKNAVPAPDHASDGSTQGSDDVAESSSSGSEALEEVSAVAASDQPVDLDDTAWHDLVVVSDGPSTTVPEDAEGRKTSSLGDLSGGDTTPADIIADQEEVPGSSLADTGSPTTPLAPPAGDSAGEPASPRQSSGPGLAESLLRRFDRSRKQETPPSEAESGDSVRDRLHGVEHTMRQFFDPGMNGIEIRLLRNIVLVATLVVFVLLLLNQAGGALILASAVIPLLIVVALTAHDVFERESPLLLIGVGSIGALAGILLGMIASWVVRSQWIDRGHLNFGAGGFGGHFAPGPAPWLVWLVVGLLIPAAIIAGLSAAPLLLRRWPQFANEVMDGMILSGTSGAGLAVGLAATFWWPMALGNAPLMNVRDWTLTIIGQAVLRPVVVTLAGTLIGAGVWRYMLDPKASIMVLAPAAGGVLCMLVLWLGSLAVQSEGIWPEFLLTLALAILAFVAYRRTLDLAIAADRATLGDSGSRIVCPACHQVTPIGAFCANCGQPLSTP